MTEDEQIITAMIEAVTREHPEVIPIVMMELAAIDVEELIKPENLLARADKFLENLDEIEANTIKQGEELNVDPETIENPPGYKVLHECRLARIRLESMREVITKYEEN